MKKKLTVLILCVGLLTGSIAEAQSVKTMQDSNIVIYSGVISPDTIGVCFVVKKGCSIEDNESVYMIKNSVSDDNGNIEFKFKMSEMMNGELTDGEYDIYMKEDKGEVTKGELVYTSLASRTVFFDAVKNVTDSNSLKNILENENNILVLKSIGCRTDLYTSGTADVMFEIIKSFSEISQDEFAATYNKAASIDGMKDADKEKADDILGILNPEFEKVEYNEISDDELKEWLASYLGGDAFSDEKYALANILYKFNNTVADKLDDLFDDYAKILGIENKSAYKSYLGLKNKAKANIEITEILGNTPAENADDILDAVEDAVKAVSDSGKNTSSGGGGGGGGSSSKVNGYTASAVTTVPEQPKEDIVEIESFADMNSAEWAKEAVSALVSAKIVSGDGNGNFRPNDPVKREEFVKMLILAAGKYNENAVCEFSDVSKDAWYYSYVASAYENGVISGVGENRAGVGQLLTRQDMAVLCVRVKSDIEKVRDDVTFADSEEIADYAREAVSKLYMSGAVNGMGDNMFVPFGQATRAQCAQIIYNLFLR